MILIYRDEGVDVLGAELLYDQLVARDFSVTFIDSDTLIESDSLQKAALLVIGGGRDLPYHEKLSGTGTEKIKDFVANGGSYLGICAGAYFATEEVIFDPDGPLRVVAKRSLRFFPGRSFGPAFGFYDYESEIGAQAAYMGNELYLYHNGGCYFEEVAHPAVKILARYEDLEQSPAALVKINYGKGCVILSGNHFERGVPHLQESNPHHGRIKEKLEKSEHKRIALFDKIMAQCGLSVPTF